MEQTAKYYIDTAALLSEIYASKHTVKSFCTEIGMERAKFSKKSKGIVPFKPDEMERIGRVLHLSDSRIVQIFLRA